MQNSLRLGRKGLRIGSRWWLWKNHLCHCCWGRGYYRSITGHNGEMAMPLDPQWKTGRFLSPKYLSKPIDEISAFLITFFFQQANIHLAFTVSKLWKTSWKEMILYYVGTHIKRTISAKEKTVSDNKGIHGRLFLCWINSLFAFISHFIGF